MISESPNMHMVLREMLRAHNWTVIDSTSSIDKAIEAVQKAQVSLLICDDASARPSTRLVRQLMNNAATICTPTLSLLLESHKNETAALSRLGQLVVSEKPITPSKFVPSFVNLFRAWEKEPLLTLRRANYLLLSGQTAVGLKTLLSLTEKPQAASVAAQAIALRLRAMGRWKDAESVLLTALKKNPKDIGSVIGLANLYMHKAMPKLAYRLLSTTQANLGPSTVLLPDLAQAALMMGRISEAIEHLYVIYHAGITDGETTSALARLLFAEGREDEAEKILLNNKLVFRRLNEGWTSAELQATPVAS